MYENLKALTLVAAIISSGPTFVKWATGPSSNKVTDFKLNCIIKCLKPNNVCKFLTLYANKSKDIEWVPFKKMHHWAPFW